MRKVAIEVPDRCVYSCPLLIMKVYDYDCPYRVSFRPHQTMKPVKACRNAEVGNDTKTV